MDTLYYYSLIRAYKWQMPNTACSAIKIFTKLNSRAILALGGPYTPVNLLEPRLLNYFEEKIIASPRSEIEDTSARGTRGEEKSQPRCGNSRALNRSIRVLPLSLSPPLSSISFQLMKMFGNLVRSRLLVHVAREFGRIEYSLRAKPFRSL